MWKGQAEAARRGVTLHLCDQANASCLHGVVAATPSGFDLIIDDGGHANVHTITSLKALWGHLRPGGLYVIEDLETQYSRGSFLCYGVDCGGGAVGKAGTAIELLKSTVDVMNRDYHGGPHPTRKQAIGRGRYSVFPGDERIASLSCFRNMCALGKWLGDEFVEGRAWGCRNAKRHVAPAAKTSGRQLQQDSEMISASKAVAGAVSPPLPYQTKSPQLPLNLRTYRQIATCSRTPVGTVGRRDAYVVSSAAFRYHGAARTLMRAGFTPHRFIPVPLNDSRVIKFEEHFRNAKREALGAARPTISCTLSHAELWARFPSSAEWLYVFEDDVLLDTDTDTQCILDAAEASARARRATFIDLGQCHANLGGALEMIASREGGMPTVLRPCESYCIHAYGVHRSIAKSLYERVRNRTLRERPSSVAMVRGFQRYNLDTNVRHFWATEPKSRWPVCAAPSSHINGKRWSEHSGIFLQNDSISKTASEGAVTWHG